MRFRYLFLALLAVIGPVSCTTLDRDGNRPLATLDTNVPEENLRPALVSVFGQRGLRAGPARMNPMRFEGMASRTQNLAYKELGGFDQVLIERAQVDLHPTPMGTRVEARVQIISNPDTMFEDTKFPIVGMRAKYTEMLKDAAAMAAGLPAPSVRTNPTTPAASNYTVPLPLEGY